MNNLDLFWQVAAWIAGALAIGAAGFFGTIEIVEKLSKRKK